MNVCCNRRLFLHSCPPNSHLKSRKTRIQTRRDPFLNQFIRMPCFFLCALRPMPEHFMLPTSLIARKSCHFLRKQFQFDFYFSLDPFFVHIICNSIFATHIQFGVVPLSAAWHRWWRYNWNTFKIMNLHKYSVSLIHLVDSADHSLQETVANALQLIQ